MKTAELIGAQLDYWVARALGYDIDIAKMKQGGKWCAIEINGANVRAPDPVDIADQDCAIAMVPNAIQPFLACVLGWKEGRGKYPRRAHWFYPSTVWDHGGPIIEREKILFSEMSLPNSGAQENWVMAIHSASRLEKPGPSYLIAAMRAFVASKYGDTVLDEP